MKRRLRRLIVFAGVLGMVMALNVGVAFATNTGSGTEWTCKDTAGAAEGTLCGFPDREPVGQAAENTLAPVGSKIFAGGKGSDAARAALTDHAQLVNNPLCPLHEVVDTS